MSQSDNRDWIAMLAEFSLYTGAVLLLPMLLLAYGTGFQMVAGAAAVRMNDTEVAATASSMAAAAARFKSDLDRAVSLATPAKEAAKKDAEALIDQANAVKSRAGNGKPATSEVRELVEYASLLQAFVARHSIPETENWLAMEASLAKLQQAFGLAR